MKRRVLAEPTLAIDPSWGGRPLIRWRRRYGCGWAYAAWWLHGGHNFYMRALRKVRRIFRGTVRDARRASQGETT